MFYLKGTDSNGAIFWMGFKSAWVENPLQARQFREKEVIAEFEAVCHRNRLLDRCDQIEPTITKGIQS